MKIVIQSHSAKLTSSRHRDKTTTDKTTTDKTTTRQNDNETKWQWTRRLLRQNNNGQNDNRLEPEPLKLESGAGAENSEDPDPPNFYGEAGATENNFLEPEQQKRGGFASLVNQQKLLIKITGTYNLKHWKKTSWLELFPCRTGTVGKT